jgi:hypothetical protein
VLLLLTKSSIDKPQEFLFTNMKQGITTCAIAVVPAAVKITEVAAYEMNIRVNFKTK